MTLVRPPSDRFQDDCQSWPWCFCIYPPLCVYKSLSPQTVNGGVSPLNRSLPSCPVAGIQNKANFPFHQLCFSSISFQAASTRIPLLATWGVETLLPILAPWKPLATWRIPGSRGEGFDIMMFLNTWVYGMRFIPIAHEGSTIHLALSHTAPPSILAKSLCAR